MLLWKYRDLALYSVCGTLITLTFFPASLHVPLMLVLAPLVFLFALSKNQAYRATRNSALENRGIDIDFVFAFQAVKYHIKAGKLN